MLVLSYTNYAETSSIYIDTREYGGQRGGQLSRNASSPATADADTEHSLSGHGMLVSKCNINEPLLQLASVNYLPEDEPAPLLLLRVGDGLDPHDDIIQEAGSEQEHEIDMYNYHDEMDEEY